MAGNKAALEGRMRMVLLSALLAMSGLASAAPIYVDFAIYQARTYAGERRGVYFGAWSFDSSLAKPNAVIEAVAGGIPLDSLAFHWLGQRWHPGNARLARLEFDANAQLRSWTIGGIATSGGCGAVGVLDCAGTPSAVADFSLTATRLESGIPPPAVIAIGVLPRMESFAEAGGIFIVRHHGISKRK
jgi:hypothetical protein